MNLTRKRIIRFLLGALLPVPLFVGIIYFSYFYTSFNGFDHETKR
jgi:cytochrome c oxidase assembly factor CtaG